jgi:hypothetical protein
MWRAPNTCSELVGGVIVNCHLKNVQHFDDLAEILANLNVVKGTLYNIL